jgi:hypothetical protein
MPRAHPMTMVGMRMMPVREAAELHSHVVTPVLLPVHHHREAGPLMCQGSVAITMYAQWLVRS